MRTTEKLDWAADLMQPWRSIHGLRLAGAYPETRIIVRYHDYRKNWDGEVDFPLWDTLFKNSMGGREDPDVVAGVILANVMG